MDTQTLTTLAIAGIAISACLVAAHQRFRVLKLEELFGATHQLAGALIHHADTDEIDRGDGLYVMDDSEFCAGTELLLDILADPDSRSATEFVKAPISERYDDILQRAKGFGYSILKEPPLV